MRMQLCFRSLVSSAAAIALVVEFSAASQAQTILFDLGNESSFRGATVTSPDSNGNTWNSVWAGAYYPNVLDINGDTTEVDLGFAADGGNDSFNGPAGVTSNPPTAGEIAATDIDAAALGNLGGALEAAFDFYVSSRFEIQGLDPAKTYDLTFFGSHKFNANNTSTYTIYTDNTFSTSVASTDLLVGVNELHNRDAVATISGVAPQTSNILYVGFDGYLNALQIQAVPEPSSLLLLAGGFGLLATIRRKQ